MNISTEDVGRLIELQESIVEALGEFKQICKESMTRQEYEDFKYNTLGHIEPAVSKDTEWVTTYSSLKSLEAIVEETKDVVTDEESNDDEDDERNA